MHILIAQAAAAAAPPVDWQQIAVVYGPFLAGVGILLKMHRDFVYNTIPRALRTIRRELKASRRATQLALDTLLSLDVCQDCRVKGATSHRERETNGQTPPRRKLTRPKTRT